MVALGSSLSVRALRWLASFGHIHSCDGMSKVMIGSCLSMALSARNRFLSGASISDTVFGVVSSLLMLRVCLGQYTDTFASNSTFVGSSSLAMFSVHSQLSSMSLLTNLACELGLLKVSPRYSISCSAMRPRTASCVAMFILLASLKNLMGLRTISLGMGVNAYSCSLDGAPTLTSLILTLVQ